jgi:3-deoxy-D-manno-oct-2-ulosonic acid (Kdo) hydroxylase
MPWTEVKDYAYPGGWAVAGHAERGRHYCEELEGGGILYFARPPFEFPDADREFLLSQRRADSALHKNVSYRPSEDTLRGFAGGPETQQRLRSILSDFSRRATALLQAFLAPYRDGYSLDYASFRPMEEEGRQLPLHKRNDLLHVDAFPSRPTHGARILRLFTNIHPSKPRVWNVGERFPVLAHRLAREAGLQRFAAQGGASLWGRVLRAVGAPIPDRSAYDRFMLHFHDYLKEQADFQAGSPKTRLEFPPQSTWLVYTDGLPHAVLSGQQALEQTFLIAREALVAPQASPIGVLETLCGRPLAGPLTPQRGLADSRAMGP